MSEMTPTVPGVRRPRRRVNDRIAGRLTAVQVAIDNALADADLQDALAEYGYTTERLLEGRRLHARVLELQHQQQYAQGSRAAALDAFRVAWQQAKTTYTRLCKVARVALGDARGDWHALGLEGGRERVFADWVAQAQQFYTNALGSPERLAKLAVYGVTQAKLQAGQAQFRAAVEANAARTRDKGSAQHATEERDAALDELLRWHGDFLKIARVALEEQPQRLEQLGVAVPA